MSAQKKTKYEDQLTQLAKMTILVCDTGDIEAIRRLKPTDATTNPSLLWKAAGLPQYKHLVDDAVEYGKKLPKDVDKGERLAATMDRLAVNFGAEITKIVPGYVSTEVDARISFDTDATVARARRIIKLYEEVGIPKSRILIKIASTWEGIKAAEILEKDGITCNLTLLFSLCQAIAAAEASATLVSPFVGRILDWYKKETGKNYEPEEDPGVQSVRQIYGYYKKYGYKTIVMGASFRNKGEILAIAGCDRLTISPQLLEELKESHDGVKRILDPATAGELYQGEKTPMTEQAFRRALNADAMATSKLAEGIRGFAGDIEKLEKIVAGLLTPADALADQFTKLAQLTTIVCDTGDVDAIKRLKPTDATTNPSLIYKAASLPRYESLVESAIKAGKEAMVDSQRERLDLILDRLCVNFGSEITKIVPGYVSTEVDARLSFDTEGTVARARRIIKLYEEVGVPKSRILIKMASTWEGIKAAEILEKEGITCNLTLLFSLCQAVAAAEAGVTLISPFVGRILDWYKKETGKNYEPDEDPGVQSVRQIYGYFKKYGYDTIVMGASFRSKGEIVALAGCDRLTISPQLLDEIKQCHEPLPKVLDPESAAALYKGEKQHLDERAFRLALNADPMATDKLAEGIRGFSADIEKLEQMVLKKL